MEVVLGCRKRVLKVLWVFFFLITIKINGGGHAEMFQSSLLKFYSITQLVTLLLTLSRVCGELQGYCSLASDGPGKAQIDLI